jgi:hypothetical protein
MSYILGYSVLPTHILLLIARNATTTERLSIFFFILCFAFGHPRTLVSQIE